LKLGFNASRNAEILKLVLKLTGVNGRSISGEDADVSGEQKREAQRKVVEMVLKKGKAVA
jgi:hypothetical protein